MYFPGLSKEDIVSKNRIESNTYEQSCKKNQFKMVTLFGQKIEASGTKRSEKVTGSSKSGLFDLNETPINEPVSDFFQDLNFQYTEETRINSEKSGFTPVRLDKVHGKDGTSSQSSCFTAENNSRIEREHSCKVIQVAAECLVHISTVSLNQNQESHTSSQDQGFLKKTEKMCIEEPSTCSCDSYELHVLGIRETVLEDESCVSSSKTIDVFNNKKESGIRVRRGKRRMKNFQKEILPELVSLSRNEIREDINILEAVLTSREYKKIQGTSKDGKCKGSAQGYVGRRRRKTE